MEKIYGSAQQTLATARTQAIKNQYPFFTLVTSTPNGTQGHGEWFYKRWSKALDSDDLFVLDPDTKKEKWIDGDIQEMLDDGELCNGFIKVQYHWSETKDEIWYNKQCQELDNQRQINQELDLVFVGTQYCIFDDDLLTKIEPIPKVDRLPVPYNLLPNAYFDLYQKPEDFDTMDYYIVGVDTASSVKGAYNAIEIFTFREFTQVAEFNFKVGSLPKYGKIVDFIVRWLMNIVGNRIIIGFENNSIGQGPLDHLFEEVRDINYRELIYSEDNKKPGINTNGISKDFMIGCLMEYINENPLGIKSKNLFNQLSSIEKTIAGNIQGKTFSDMFMACCFCAMVRKRKAIDIGPLLGVANEKIAKDTSNLYRNIIEMNNPKRILINEQFRNPFIDEAEIMVMNTEQDLERDKFYQKSKNYQDDLFEEQIAILSNIM